MQMEINTPVYSGPERRRYKRAVYWSYACYKQSHKDSKFEQAEIRNISQGGMLFQTRQKVLLANPLEAKLYLPYAKGFQLISAIIKPIWQKRSENKEFWHTGVEFQYLDAESKAILAKFVDSFQSHFTSLHRGFLERGFLYLPYWCLVKQTRMGAKFPPKVTGEKNSFNVIFESEQKYAVRAKLELELKIPTITLPFTARGIVLDAKEIRKNSNYSICLQLNQLTQEQLAAIKKFAQQQ